MAFETLAVIFLALAAGALAKGATGMGLPLLSIPVMASFLPLPQAVVILVVPIIVTNAWQVWRFRHAGDARLRFLPPLLGGGVLGGVGGTLLLTTAPERWLELTLGVLLLAYLALRLARPGFRVGEQAGRRWALPVGLGAGVLQGTTGISAPIGVTFIHAMRLEREAHVLAVSAMFLAIALAQLPTQAAAGVLRPEWLLQGVLSLVPVAVFMPVGQWLAGFMSATAFDRLILAFLGVIGAKMVLGL